VTLGFSRLVEDVPEIVEVHRIASHADYAVRFCGGDMTAWNAFREGLEALGCDAQAQFSLLVDALK
jgi:hypothetical protein